MVACSSETCAEALEHSGIDTLRWFDAPPDGDCPVVTVPVLSKITEETSERFSRKPEPLIRMPCRAATAIAATAVAGAAIARAHGQDATSTASIADVLPVSSHVPAATSRTSAHILAGVFVEQPG